MKTVFLIYGPAFRGDSIEEAGAFIVISNPFPLSGAPSIYFPQVATEMRIPLTNVRYIVEGEQGEQPK